MQHSTDADDFRNWPLNVWLPLAGISRPMLYKLEPDDRPHTCRIGRKILVTESPRDWAERVGKAA